MMMWSSKLPSEMMLNLESLRALELNCLCISELPDSMGYLRHLRYLNLEGNEGIRRLPETIGMLYNLQVLNLNECWNLGSLPESIGGVCNLRYLNLNCCSLESLPEGIGGLGNLQCLEIEGNYNLSYPRGMSRLTNLRSLLGFTVTSRRRGSGEVHGMELLKDMVHLKGIFKILGLENVVNPEDVMMANLRNKEHIRELQLGWSGSKGDNDDGEKAYCVLENLRPPNGLEELQIDGHVKVVRFPSCMGGDASSLSRLSLLDCRRCTLLPPLGQLPSLKFLEIWNADSVEKVGPEFRGVGFPALEWLHFRHMSSWVTWDAAERGDFPRLRQLTVSDCPKLQSMVPVYLFPALKYLEIRNCGSLPSIELRMPSSSSSSIGPPPLVEMTISNCPLARFSPEDEPLLLPATLRQLSVDSGCPWLLEWCGRDDGRRLAHIPELKTGPVPAPPWIHFVPRPRVMKRDVPKKEIVGGGCPQKVPGCT